MADEEKPVPLYHGQIIAKMSDAELQTAISALEERHDTVKEKMASPKFIEKAKSMKNKKPFEPNEAFKELLNALKTELVKRNEQQ